MTEKVYITATYILLLFCSIVYVKDLELSFVPDSDLWWQEQEYKDEEPSI